MQEFNFDIEYIQGKDNKVADFLSRIENSPKISKENSSESNMDLSDTKHSVEEQLLDHIGIREEIVNKYKTQLILTYSPRTEIETKHGRRILQINPQIEPKLIIEKLKQYIKSGKIGIYSEVNEKDYNKVQLLIIELFSEEQKIKFIKSTKRAQELDMEIDCHK